MIERGGFSERGDAPTEFERRLLQTAAASESPWDLVAARLVTDLGLEVGALALVAVLDELGGEKPHVPTREWFFRRLWAVHRDAQIADLKAREPRISASELGRRIGVSRQHASGLLKRAQAGGTTPTHRAGTGGAHD